MKQSEIKELSTAELQEKLSETKKAYADLKNDTCYITFGKSDPVAKRKT